MPRRAEEPSSALGRGEQADHPQAEQLPVGGCLDAELLGRRLQVTRAAFGERQRGVGHPPQLHPLLRPRGRQGALEVDPCSLRVVALGRPRAEDRLRGGAILGLRLEFLVGARLELLHRRQLALLFDPHRALLGHA